MVGNHPLTHLYANMSEEWYCDVDVDGLCGTWPIKLAQDVAFLPSLMRLNVHLHICLHMCHLLNVKK